MIDKAVAKESIVEWLYEGKSLLQFCAIEGNPKRRTIYDWRDADPAFAAQFARAREAGADVMFEMAQQVADDGRNDTYTDDEGNEVVDHDNVQRSKLRVETYLKRAACYSPKVYGTRIQHGGDGSGVPIQVVTGVPAPES